MDKNSVVAIGVITIGGILCFAVHNEINGTILSAGLTVIGTIIGFVFGYGRGQSSVVDTP